MDKRMEELLNYERRVIEDRQQLSKLIEETDVNDTKLMKEKLDISAELDARMDELRKTTHLDG